MASWRFAQRGHLSFPTALAGLEKTGPGWWRIRRGMAPMAVLLVAVVLLALAQRDAVKQPATDIDSDNRIEPASLIDSAIARLQDAPRSPKPALVSGLTAVPLNSEQLKAVRPLMGQAEARLIEIYQLIGQARHREALEKAQSLVRDHPNFQLAHLVHGDLLSLRVRPVRRLGDVPDTKALAASRELLALREESSRRLRALTERPPEGSIPTQFLTLSPRSRHAIAIDASRSRLYLFENLHATARPAADNRAPSLKLLGDFYISVGLSGIEKTAEGDKRTPLGVYYITSTLDPARLPDLYGVGALPINYPNALDVQRGKTGSGIWLHGTPSDQFVRAPLASDGCVVLSNPDLERLLSTVQVRTTPVVIAPELQWTRPEAQDADRAQFEAVLDAWRQARSAGDPAGLKAFYSHRFTSQGRDLAQWWPRVEGELRNSPSREVQLKDLSVLHWRDQEDTLVVTFGEVPVGKSRGVTRRQYWTREQDRWTIFHEGTL